MVGAGYGRCTLCDVMHDRIERRPEDDWLARRSAQNG